MDKKQTIQDKVENEKEKRELVNLEKIIQIEEIDWWQAIQYYYYSFLEEKEELLIKDNFDKNTLSCQDLYLYSNLELKV